jgi:hypothetical protein
MLDTRGSWALTPAGRAGAADFAVGDEVRARDKDTFFKAKACHLPPRVPRTTWSLAPAG